MFSWLKSYKAPAKEPIIPALMSKGQRELFMKYLNNANGYFEFGCGGSTAIADSTEKLQRITSVESDYDWAKRISDLFPNVTMLWIDIGPTGEFGRPTDETLRPTWGRYSDIWNKAEHTYDMVLIDGRFRVACCLAVILNQKGVKWIVFDDYKSRQQYHVIAPFVDIIESADSMIICVPKRRFDRESAATLYEEYKFNPD
jgi:protein O-GlcNAc transferase